MSSKVNVIVEDMCKNAKALGLVSMMGPIELMKGLMKHKELVPKDAAKVVLDLKKKAEGLSGASIETNKGFPVPASMKAGPEDEDVDEAITTVGGGTKVRGGGGGPDVIKRHHFPPDPRPNYDSSGEDDEGIYKASFVNYMNNPKRKRPMMSGIEKMDIDPEDLSSEPNLPGGTRAGNVKHKNPLDIDLRANQPGGDGAGGAGIYQKSTHSRDNSTPTQGTNWTTRGVPGWSTTDNNFDRPPQSIRKKDKGPVELAQPVSSVGSRGPDNAGDEDDTPSFMKEPNVGSQLSVVGYGGPTPVRVNKTGYRGYGRK